MDSSLTKNLKKNAPPWPLAAIRPRGKFHILTWPVRLSAMEVAYYTYMKFKGCESKEVILLDVDEGDDRWSSRNEINTAMSRAVHQLIILRK